MGPQQRNSPYEPAVRDLDSPHHRTRTTQARRTTGAHGQRVPIETDLDVFRVDAGKSEDELQTLCGLLNVHGRLPHCRVSARSDVTDEFALHAVGAVQNLAGLGPHPAELAINAHVNWATPNLPNRYFPMR